MAILDENATEVQAIALGIIGDIERNGHYQGVGPMYRSHGSRKAGSQPCCLIASPTSHRDSVSGSSKYQTALEFARAAGVVKEHERYVTFINDALTTDEVLDALWAVALG